jgi:hypothetical protein
VENTVKLTTASLDEAEKVEFTSTNAFFLHVDDKSTPVESANTEEMNVLVAVKLLRSL